MARPEGLGQALKKLVIVGTVINPSVVDWSFGK